ncbi:MAG: hypothetical protein Q9204_003991 [Flavoplaca sp. TL-2023a]
MPFTASDIIKIIFAIFLPPVGVALEKGIGSDFCINVLLTILGYIPGIIHALYVIPERVDVMEAAAASYCASFYLQRAAAVERRTDRAVIALAPEPQVLNQKKIVRCDQT